MVSTFLSPQIHNRYKETLQSPQPFPSQMPSSKDNICEYASALREISSNRENQRPLKIQHRTELFFVDFFFFFALTSPRWLNVDGFVVARITR